MNRSRQSIIKPVSYTRMSYMDAHQLRSGMRHEMEHTTNKMIALQIAAHHLMEIPDYYSRLAKMERQAKKYWKGR